MRVRRRLEKISAPNEPWLYASVIAAIAICGMTLSASSAETNELPVCKKLQDADGRALRRLGTSRRSDPGPDQTRTVEIGQPVLQNMEVGIYPGHASLSSNVEFQGYGQLAGYSVSIPVGDLSAFAATAEIRMYESAGGKVMFEGKPIEARVGLGVRAEPTKPLRVWWVRTTKSFLGVPRVDSFANDLPGTIIQELNCVGPSEKNFKTEIIYSGSTGTTINLLYREYSNDMARSAFTQQLTYDLKNGSEIGYRGSRISVLKASNIDITFRVIKPLE